MLLGTFRFILAYLIALAHLVPTFKYFSGVYALLAFFIMSGFMMTYILNESYGFDVKGIKKFYINRSLRIYPAYWFCYIIVFLIVINSPETALCEWKGSVVLPSSVPEWLYNIFIFGIINPLYGLSSSVKYAFNNSLIQPAWAVNLELILYILIPFLSKTFRRTIIWFLISILITVLIIINFEHYSYRYYTTFAVSLPFSVGALLYYILYKTKIGSKFTFNKIAFLIASVLFFLHMYYTSHFWGYYRSLLVMPLFLIFLVRFPVDKIPKILRKIDTFLGDLAYSVYLLHLGISFLVVNIFFDGKYISQSSPLRWKMFLLTVPILFIFSVIVYFVVEKRIVLFRNKIRGFKVN